ncbi:formate dehydrogenase subunit gamma [Massilia sp.]|uniref:formate dehydrogenase subunit gamma n=1 Tax=Massilia sp. TaxID=1882437 RepID=UPI00289EDC36|nr:formate dehydrogenase subunit gamma [Massilia sp.]
MNPADSLSADRIIGDILELHAHCGALGQDALLPVLHAIQDRLGFVPPDAVEGLAHSFNLSRAEVHGVITFYHHFKTTPPARCTVQICRAEACQSMGGDALLSHAEQALGCGLHAHSADGGFALEPVYCLGQCATAPAIMINDSVHARVTPARFDRLLANVAPTVTEAA